MAPCSFGIGYTIEIGVILFGIKRRYLVFLIFLFSLHMYGGDLLAIENLKLYISPGLSYNVLGDGHSHSGAYKGFSSSLSLGGRYDLKDNVYFFSGLKFDNFLLSNATTDLQIHGFELDAGAAVSLNRLLLSSRVGYSYFNSAQFTNRAFTWGVGVGLALDKRWSIFLRHKRFNLNQNIDLSNTISQYGLFLDYAWKAPWLK